MRQLTLQEARQKAIRGEFKYQEPKPAIEAVDKPDPSLTIADSIKESAERTAEATAKILADAITRIERQSADNVREIVQAIPKQKQASTEYKISVTKRDKDGNISELVVSRNG